MKGSKWLACILSMASLTGQGEARNWCWVTDRAVTFGYHNDYIVTDTEGLNASGEAISTDDLKGDGIGIFEVGVQGTVRFWNTWLVKGRVGFGWVKNGRYREDSESTSIDISKGKINEGYTRAYSAALGYSWTCWTPFSFEPLIGYAYDFEEIEMFKVITNGATDDTLSNLRYRMSWEGPWVGMNARLATCCLRAVLGYEYHWTDWEARWLLEGSDVSGVAFSDKRKSDDSSGHVVFFESSYSLHKCWSIGLGVKYQYWDACDGKLKPIDGSLSDKGFDNLDKVKVSKATWRSYQIKLMLGCSF